MFLIQNTHLIYQKMLYHKSWDRFYCFGKWWNLDPIRSNFQQLNSIYFFLFVLKPYKNQTQQGVSAGKKCSEPTQRTTNTPTVKQGQPDGDTGLKMSRGDLIKWSELMWRRGERWHACWTENVNRWSPASNKSKTLPPRQRRRHWLIKSVISELKIVWGQRRRKRDAELTK